jgi:hypothetical protein
VLPFLLPSASGQERGLHESRSVRVHEKARVDCVEIVETSRHGFSKPFSSGWRVVRSASWRGSDYRTTAQRRSAAPSGQLLAQIAAFLEASGARLLEHDGGALRILGRAPAVAEAVAEIEAGERLAEITALLVERCRALRVLGDTLTVLDRIPELVAPAPVLRRAGLFEQRGGALQVLWGDVAVANEDAEILARLRDPLIAALAEELGALRRVGGRPLAEGQVRPVCGARCEVPGPGPALGPACFAPVNGTCPVGCPLCG